MNYLPLDTQAVLDFPLTGVQLIEASAGTGKTYSITNLFLRHLVNGREIGDLLVVTFTKAATDELRGRIRARLAETLECLEQRRTTGDEFLQALLGRIENQGQVPLAIKRLRVAVRAMDESAIFTIHSFCQRALSEFAFHSGQQFQMEVLTDDQELWDQAVADWWRRQGYPLDPARLHLFDASLGSLEQFRGLLTPLLGAQRHQLVPKTDPTGQVLDRFEGIRESLQTLAGQWSQQGDRLRQLLSTSKGLSRAQESPYHKDRLAQSLAELDHYFAGDQALPPPAGFQVLAAQTLASRALQRQDPALQDPFFAACGQVWQDLERLQRDLRAAALAEAAEFAQTQVRTAKQQAQTLSFDDLLTELHRALTGPGGEALAAEIRQRFPVAMIDEFQDTDPVQYGIFRKLYLGQEGLALIMIGDPKQAIYSFRGGDIFTYMQAKQDLAGGQLYTLTTNWRSTPQVINGVNQIFQRRGADSFVFGDQIPFLATVPAPQNHRWLLESGTPRTALTLWTLPEETNAQGNAKPLSKEKAEDMTHAAVADEIARLIAGGRAHTICLGDRPLEPKDIAVLVPDKFAAAGLRRALTQRGVNAVTVGKESVFQSEEALGLQTLLQGVLTPGDRSNARLALTSSLLGQDYAAIERITQSEDDWAAWVDQLLKLQKTWQRRGFMALFQALLRDLDIARALSREQDAERRLTNLLHLGELLQQASKAHTGLDALLAWYRRQRAESGADEAILRLESDEALVRIVTIHASKGLEYPVVFAPYLWKCKPRNLKGLLQFHQGQQSYLDANSDAIDQHLRLAERERLAEDVRLVYVALTRAASALYLTWGRVGTRPGHTGQTALAYLLHSGQTGQQLQQDLPDAFAGRASLAPDLASLAEAAGGDIQCLPMPVGGAFTPLAAAAAPLALAPRTFSGKIATDWRVSSFSALTRDQHTGGHPAQDPPAGDDAALRLPAGSHVGSYLHQILEQLDFQRDIPSQVLAHSARLAPRFGLDHGRWGKDAATLLDWAVHTPLDASGLCLASLTPDRRLNELEFDFATGRVDITGLDQLLGQMAGRPLPPLEADSFRGMVNGIIDLVFEHQGRYYIADYKSNRLGGTLDAYQPEALRAAMFQYRYDLQCLLYALALHRYLRQRIPDYRYQTHFGGVFYLFLRGMRPETGYERGVHAICPDLTLIDTLDQHIFRHDLGAAQ